MIPGHQKPLAASHCELCFAYHTDARYRDLIDRVIAIAATVPRSSMKDCVHAIRDATTQEIADLGGQPARRHVHCALGLGRLRVLAMRCGDCGEHCKGFVPVPEDGSEI